jgi:hypothetical protein
MVEVVGLKLETHQPVIERVSTKAGNGSFCCRDRWAKRALLPSRDRSRDWLGIRKAPNPRSKCNQTWRSLSPEDWVVEVVGLKLGTHHPVIEPVSALRRERNFRPQRQAGKSPAIAYQRQIQGPTTQSSNQSELHPVLLTPA